MSTGPTYQVIFRPSAAKALRKLPRDAQRTIREKARALATDPRPHGHIKLIDSDDLYRVRAGNYRIVYTIEDTALVVEVVKVGDRKDIYGP